VFTIRKLEALPAGTRRRKIERLLHAAEVDLGQGRAVEPRYLGEIVALLDGDRGLAWAARQRIAELRAEIVGLEGAPLLRAVNSIRNRLLLELGAEPSEWDMVGAQSPGLDPAARRVFPFRVYLEDIRSPFNVGSIFRTAECFGAEEILLSPDTPLPTHHRAMKTARGTAEVLRWRVCGLEELREEPSVFALELGGEPVQTFPFPPSGTVIVGSEELGVSPAALELARRSKGRVSIPLYGAKQSLNVSVAFGILINAWSSAAAAPGAPESQPRLGPERESSSSSAITP
jgi:RNA methyltransferase, TrmH family